MEIEKLANHILDTYKISVVGPRYLWVNDNKITRKEFYTYISLKTLIDILGSEVIDMTETNRQALIAEAVDISVAYLKDSERERIAKKFDLHTIPDSSINMDILKPLVNIQNNERFLYNVKSCGVSKICYKAWEAKLSKEEREFLNGTIIDSIMEYDPYDISPFKQIEYETMELVRVNMYTPPDWRKDDDRGLEVPEIIWDVLEHLFPQDKQLDFVLNWMYQAIVNRNETFLVLNGKKGIGKGVFCSLLSALVGQDHFTEAPVGLLSGTFNASLDKHRIIHLDEFVVKKTEYGKLKKYINKNQNIEKKGIDADQSIETYNSYVISNNDEDMYLEQDDRRFSVPDLTEKRVLDIMSQEDLDSLHRELDDHNSDLVHAIGYYIYNHGKDPKLTSFSDLKGERFYLLAYTSLKEWEKFIVDTILAREESVIPLKKIGNKYRTENKYNSSQFPRKYTKIQSLFNKYRENGVHLLGEVVKLEGEMVIIPSERYLPDDEEAF